MPPEMQAAFSEQEAHMEMHRQADLHSVRDLLSALDKEQLQALDLVLRMASSKRRNAMLRGLVDGQLQFRFNICLCGKNHDEDELLAAPARAEGVAEESLPGFEEPQDADHAQAVSADAAARGRAKLLEEYNLSPGIIDGVQGFVCKGCGLYYVSLEDRMLRAPGVEGCHGCQNKAKFG